MNACSDHLMRGVVLAPGWARDLRDFARTEYGVCAPRWLLAQVGASPGDRPLRRGLRAILRGLRPATKADSGADPIEV